MDHYQPTFDSKETARNIEDYIDATKPEFWKIFTPLMPFIAACHILDAVISNLFFAESEGVFVLFSIVAAYFVTALVITWHRVVIHGPDNYTPMNPFKPKRHELVFIGVGLLIALVFVLISVGGSIGVVVTKSSILGLFVVLPLKLYFEPLLTIIGVTALSNYYLYAIQNEVTKG